MPKSVKVTVNPQRMAFAMKFVSRDEARPTLHAVRFRAADHAVIATDGHTALRYLNAHELKDDISLVIPGYVRPRLAKSESAELEYLDGARWLLTLANGEGFLVRSQPDDYPDIDKVIPVADGCSLKTIAVNPRYVYRFSEGDRNGAVFTFFGPEKAIRVNYDGDEDFIGLIMPVRVLEPID